MLPGNKFEIGTCDADYKQPIVGATLSLLHVVGKNSESLLIFGVFLIVHLIFESLFRRQIGL